MPPIPITGDRLYDFVLVFVLIIAGMGVVFKAGQWWGWLLVAAAGYWAYQLVRIYM